MLIDATPNTFTAIYMCCGRTDLRKSIDGLINLLVYTYKVNPYLAENVLFLFCGNSTYKIKGLVMEKNGPVLINKRLTKERFQWNRKEEAGLQELSFEQFSHLMNYGTIE